MGVCHQDANIRRRPLELAALHASKLRVVMLTGGELRGDDMGRLLVQALLSRLENDVRPLPRRVDLLIRLVVAAYLAKKRGKSFPDDMVRLIEQLEKTWDIGTHRLKHVDSVTPDREWEEASV